MNSQIKRDYDILTNETKQLKMNYSPEYIKEMETKLYNRTENKLLCEKISLMDSQIKYFKDRIILLKENETSRMNESGIKEEE